MSGNDRTPNEGYGRRCGEQQHDGSGLRKVPQVERICLTSDSDTPLETARTEYQGFRPNRRDPAGEPVAGLPMEDGTNMLYFLRHL